MQQINRIREKLSQLRNTDTKRELPGAGIHQYRLNPPLEPEQVQLFEATHRVQLPDEYIAFLTILGDGGAGPFYGLRRLETSNICFFDPSGEAAHQYFDLSRPFPHTASWNMEAELEQLDARLEAAYEAGNQQLEKLLFEKKWELISGTEHDQGRLCLADDGCIQVSLIINGPEKGNMWADERINDGDMHPLNQLGSTERLTFLNWYELWLDQALAKIQGTQRRFFSVLLPNGTRKVPDYIPCK
ncbi:SMI1/KNR4 family protein [Niabella sp. CC-SYL272]|uniref:SMI1/KNR4 family protein n=1 Tax=Niabella agricola TaxID=2891571 RepID=UPI001F299FBF|nr:SMI1/KNR4 family protein [Niabella agricola]MCF3111173.1 SMI1/KNR4 family protein [Niabella agricola]